MKRYLLLFMAFLTLSTGAFAQVPWHKNQLAFIAINGTTFINFIFDKASVFGFNKEIASQFATSFLSNSGSDLMKDFNNIGVLIYLGKDKKMHFIGFMSGNFQPDKWYNELQTIANDTKAKMMMKTELRTSGNHKILDIISKKRNATSGTTSNKENTAATEKIFSICFQSNKRVLFGSKSELEIALKSLKNAPGPIERQIRKQTFFAFLDMQTANQMLEKAPNPQAQSIVPMIKPLSKIYIFLTDSKLMLRFQCVSAEQAGNYHTMLKGMIASLKQKLENDLKSLEEPLSQPGWLLNSISYFGKKGSLLSSKNTLDSIIIANKKDVIMIKATLPPIVNSGFIPIAMLGTLSAIAIPNFRKARNNARTKACFANQRVMLGAIEMYNMDNPTMIQNIESDTIDKLVQGTYLRNPVICPDGGTYSSIGDISSTGKITCSEHGSVTK